MKPEFSGIERRLDKLDVCLKKLEPFRLKKKEESFKDPYFQDIIERNLQVAAQSVVDIANRIISLDALEKPRDYYGAILILGQAGILPSDFAQKLAPIAGFRNILVHDYLEIDWNEVYCNLQHLDDLVTYMQHVKNWVREQESSQED
jgi:uncharacterized protein YutE (UPF0331/DUF86 family)